MTSSVGGGSAAAVRSETIAWRTSRRSKNRSPPRTRYGTPTWASACSYPSDCALIRYRIAISLAATPASSSVRTRAATAAASVGSSSNSANLGSGPGGRCPTSRSREPAGRLRAAPITLLASSTTCGVER